MESNVVECAEATLAGSMSGAGADCSCRNRSAAPTASLAVLQEVHRAYEGRLDAIERKGGKKKLELQVEVLRAWVGDLVGQNTLLARAVEELELDATSRLLLERTRHTEIEAELRVELSAMRRRLARKDSDLRGLVEVLRRLREFDYCTLDGIHFFEVTESDIFGSVHCRRQKKLAQAQGAARTRTKQECRPTDRYYKLL